MSLSELADFFIFISICCILFDCVKSVQIRSFFWSFFSCIRTECGQEKTSYLDTFHAVFDFTLSDMNTCFRRWLINGDLNYVFQFRRKLGRPKMSRKNILCLFISLPQQLLKCILDNRRSEFFKRKHSLKMWQFSHLGKKKYWLKLKW